MQFEKALYATTINFFAYRGVTGRAHELEDLTGQMGGRGWIPGTQAEWILNSAGIKPVSRRFSFVALVHCDIMP